MVNTDNVNVDAGGRINNPKKDNNDNNLDNAVNAKPSDTINITDQKESESKGSGVTINPTYPMNNDSTNNQTMEKKFFNFTFFKVDPKWRWLNEIGKDE
ncbi:MAG: hypothetical protein M3M88_08260, partial [Thermoproteota archaeon]|nr:hypothetical protein [Thermoproteota archaeon]